nr:ribonuclease H-like domain-containing protein [Tanacetum cinerariifolium]
MLAKQNDLMSKEKKVNTTPINYVELNRLSEDFDKRFVPQQELSDKQAFWFQTSHPNTDQSASSAVKIEAPKKLPKGSDATDVPSSSSLINDSKLAKDGLARGLPKLKFKKNHLCSACALGKSKKSSHQPKAEDTNQEKLYLLHMDLCSPMGVERINGKKYILVIINDYSRFTLVKFMRSKDEAPNAIIKCIKNIQVHLNAPTHNVQTDNRTEFVNQSLREFYENVGISHQTSIARTPQQNGVVERRNRTLVEAARIMSY